MKRRVWLERRTLRGWLADRTTDALCDLMRALDGLRRLLT